MSQELTFCLIRKPHVVAMSQKMPGEAVSPLTPGLLLPRGSHQHGHDRYSTILNLDRSGRANSQNVFERIC